MKKNFVRVMLFGALALTVSTTVTSCKDYDDDIKGLQEQVDKITSTSPVSTEDMNAAVDKASKELKDQLTKLEKLVNDPSSETSLTQQIKDLKKSLETAVGENAADLAGKLATAQNDLKILKETLGGEDYIKGLKQKITDLEDAKKTLAHLITAEKQFAANGSLVGYEETGLVKLVNQQIMDAFSTEGTPSDVAKYVSEAIKSQIAATVKDVKFPFGTEQSLGDIISKIYNDIYKDRDAVAANFGKLDELLEAIDAYVGTGDGKYADYDAIIKQINDTKNDLAALLAPTGDNSLTKKVQDIIATELQTKDSELKKMQDALQKEIDAIKGMIQSIVYVPESADRTVEFTSLYIASSYPVTTPVSATWAEMGNTLERKVKFRVSPASVIEELIKADSKYEITADAQALTRSASIFTVAGVTKAPGDDSNLIEVTLKANAFATGVNGYAVALTVKGKDEKKELSDISSDYLAITKTISYIRGVEYSWKEGSAPTSIIREADGKSSTIDYKANGAYVIKVAAVKQNGTATEDKTPNELGINLAQFDVAFAINSSTAGGATPDKFECKAGVLSAKEAAVKGNKCSVKPTVTIKYGSAPTTVTITGTDYATVTLATKGGDVNLAFSDLKWNTGEKTYTLVADPVAPATLGAGELKGLTAILAALGDGTTPATDLTGATFVANPAQSADKPYMKLESDAVKIVVPADYVTTGAENLSIALTLNNKTVTVNAAITVNATVTGDFNTWNWNSLNNNPGNEMMLMKLDNDDKPTTVTLSRKLTQAYDATVFEWLNSKKTAGELVLGSTITPTATGTMSTDGNYTYSIAAGTVSYSYLKGGKPNPISVKFSAKSNKVEIFPADKSTVNILIPVADLNGTLILPDKRAVETDKKDDQIDLSTAFNPETPAAGQPAAKNFVWKDKRGFIMWPTLEVNESTSAIEHFGTGMTPATALKMYGLSLKFVPSNKAEFDKYFVLTNDNKVKLNTTTAGQEIIGTDLVAKIKLQATSKWGAVVGDATEFTVTFKAGAK